MPKKKDYTPLLNGCHRTEIAVSPTNWKNKRVNLVKEWFIWYRFFDPAHRDEYPKGKLVKIRGMNKFHELELRQKETLELLEQEEYLIDYQCFNPISRIYMQPPAPPGEPKESRPVTPKTGLIPVLDWAYENISPAPATLSNIKTALAAAWQAAEELKLATKPIGAVEKADMRLILDRIGKIKGPNWTNTAFNRYKGHLGMLFFFLEDYDVFKINPIKGIKKKTVVRAIREVLDDEQLNQVEQEMKAFNYYYWRFLKIFRESGCRRPEILRVQYSQVDIKNRRFKALVKKDKQYKEVWKDIAPSVLHLWKEVMKEAAAINAMGGIGNLYLFCEGLVPMFRDRPLGERQLTRRWRTHIKGKMGISADFYSLKHGRTTSDIDRFVDKAIRKARRKAAKKNSHTTTAMVEKIYDVNQDRRSAIIRKLQGLRRKKVIVRTRSIKPDFPQCSSSV